MTIDRTDLAARGGPRYRALAEALEEAIGSGTLEAGSRLPAQRDLAFRLGVTVGTVGRAYDQLIRRGLARGEVGRGTFVLGSGGATARSTGAGGFLSPTETPAPHVIDLSTNQPVRVAAHEQIADELADLAADRTLVAASLRYPPHGGHQAHRAAAAAWLAKLGVDAAAEDVLLTCGAQGALAVALAALTRPGDTVMVEQLAYPGIHACARRFGLRLEPLAMDEHGLLPEAVAQACRHGPARVLIASLNLQNPTLRTMPEARRRELAGIVRANDVMVIQDEVYGPLLEDRPPALSTMAPDHVVLVTSVSKFLAPGLRFGILKVPRRHFDQMLAAHLDLTLAASPLLGALFAGLMERGIVERALIEQRAAVARAQALARTVFEPAAGRLAFRGDPFALHGLLCLPDGMRGDDAALLLAEAGIRVPTLSRFASGRDAGIEGLRLSLGGLAEEALEPALVRLRDLLDGGARSLNVI